MIEGRFVAVPHPMWRDARLQKTPHAVRVYCEVFQYERKRKAPYVGRKVLAAALGISVDTVDRTVRALVASGWVRIDRRGGQTHLWHRGDGRTDAAIDGRTDAAGMAAPARPEVEEAVDEESSRSMKASPSRRASAPRRPHTAGIGFDLLAALTREPPANREASAWTYPALAAA